MDCLLKTQPQDDPVYRFMDKNRPRSKPYLVYMTSKFLRIYYGISGIISGKLRKYPSLCKNHIAHTLKASYDRKS